MHPVISSFTNKIYHADCFEFMKSLPEEFNESVDLILIDPPYGITRNNWDQDLIDYNELFDLYKKLINKRGSIVIFSYFSVDKIMFSELNKENKNMFKYQWIWEKNIPTGFLNANSSPLRKHELILVFSKSSAAFNRDKTKLMKYNPQGIVKVDGISKRTKSTNYNAKYMAEVSPRNYTNYPHDILRFEHDRLDRGLHPTQKPVKLLEYLIKTYSDEGDLILDTFAGSGSTGIACINTNRNYILIEKEEKYYNIATKRLDKFYSFGKL